MIRTYDRLRNGIATHSPAAADEQEVKRPGLDWCSLGAMVGLSGGLIASLSGSLLTAISWLTATEGGSSIVRTLGTILLFVTLPLLIFGAHCLDLREHAPDDDAPL